MDRGININRCSASCRTWWLELFGTSATRVSRSLALLRDHTRGPRFSINGSITQKPCRCFYPRDLGRSESIVYCIAVEKEEKNQQLPSSQKSYLIDDCNFSTDVESRLSLSPIINPRRVHNETKQRNRGWKSFRSKIFRAALSTPRHDGKRKKYDGRREGREKEGDNTPMHTRYIRFRATEYLHLPIISWLGIRLAG